MGEEGFGFQSNICHFVFDFWKNVGMCLVFNQIPAILSLNFGRMLLYRLLVFSVKLPAIWSLIFGRTLFFDLERINGETLFSGSLGGKFEKLWNL
jgi:hypothetical protein